MSEPLGNGIDTAVRLRPSDKDVLNMVDAAIEAAVAQGDLTPAMTFGRALRRQMQASGLALAKLLYRLQEKWELFQAAGIDDEFVDVIYAEMGVAAGTTNKYVALWSSIFANPQIPDSIKDALEDKPIRSLILLTAAAREENLDWDKVVDATTPHEIREIVREARGQQTSSHSALVLEINVRNGILTARRGDTQVNFGALTVKDYNKNDLIKAAIDRVVSSAGILEK